MAIAVNASFSPSGTSGQLAISGIQVVSGASVTNIIRTDTLGTVTLSASIRTNKLTYSQDCTQWGAWNGTPVLTTTTVQDNQSGATAQASTDTVTIPNDSTVYTIQGVVGKGTAFADISTYFNGGTSSYYHYAINTATGAYVYFDNSSNIISSGTATDLGSVGWGILFTRANNSTGNTSISVIFSPSRYTSWTNGVVPTANVAGTGTTTFTKFMVTAGSNAWQSYIATTTDAVSVTDYSYTSAGVVTLGQTASGTYVWNGSGTLGPYGASSATLSIGGSAVGAQAETGTSPVVSLAFGGSAAGFRGETGTSAATLALGGSAAGIRGEIGTSSATLAIGGSAAGTRNETGTSSVALSIGGSAAGTFTPATVTGTSSAIVAIGGSAAGTLGEAGTSSVALVFGGSAAGNRGAIGTSSATIAFGGSVTGTRGETGTSPVVSLSFGGSAAGWVVASGTSAATLTFGGSATGTRAETGTSGATLTFPGSATGTYNETGTSSAAISFGGSATGIATVSGTSTASVVFSGSASGNLGETGTSSSVLAVGGSAAGFRGAIGTSAAALAIGGSAAGARVETGTSAASITFGGSATGASVVGTSSATITFIASAAGTVGERGTSSATISFSGSAAGTIGETGTSAASLALAGSATGVIGSGISGSSFASIQIGTPQATGIVSVSGGSTAALAFGGSATGTFAQISVTGTSSATLVFGGSATGTFTDTSGGGVVTPPLGGGRGAGRGSGVGGAGRRHWLPDTYLTFPDDDAVEEAEPAAARIRVAATLPGMTLRAQGAAHCQALVRASFALPTLAVRAEALNARVRAQIELAAPGLSARAIVAHRVNISGIIGSVSLAMKVEHEVFSPEEMSMILLMIQKMMEVA